LNTLDSEVVRNAAAGSGETVVVNTCAVTGEAVRQARQAIRKARRDSPSARVVVTGCAAQIEPDTFTQMPEVDLVLGNEEKLRAESYRAPADRTRVRVGDIMAVETAQIQKVDKLGARARAYVQVQTGCDHRCTFCIIPFGRGNSRSVPLKAVVDQARTLVQNGFREIVLTGVDMTSYGADLEGRPTLGALAAALLGALPDLPRLRLSSIDAVEVDDTLFDLIANEPRLMPHLHLSLQAGSDMILKRMKRRHSRADAIRFCETVRQVRPDIAFGADLIAGFPTETEAMFEESLSLIDACGLAFTHVFPYSPRPGTPAARMPQVEGPIIRDRAARLRAAGEAARHRDFSARLGQRATVLVEKPGLGRTESFAQIRLAGAHAPGALVPARITGQDGAFLRGEPLR
jgi:threonylcarbamoyladenosine tRNA methylthiotransferase MtaB